MPTVVTDRLTRGRDFSVGIFPQATKGVVDSNPAFVPYRRSSGKPKRAVGYTQDDTVLVDNQGQQNIQDSNEYSAEITSSFSKQSVGLLLQAIHGSEVAYTNTAITYEADATGFTVPAGAYSALSVGDGFWVTGFATASINGFYIVKTKDASNHISTTIAPATTEEDGASVTLKFNKTVNADAATYNLVQGRVTDLSETADISYTTLYDAVIDTFSVEIGETGIVKSTAKFVADRAIPGTLPISGQSYVAALTDRSVSAVQNIAGFYVDGLSYTCTQKSLTVNIANGYSGDDAAGCSKQWARGQFAVTGSAAFRSRISSSQDWKVIYENGTAKALGVRITHGNGDETFLLIPQMLTTEHDQADGGNDIANHEISFGAEGNAAANATIIVYRNWV